MLIPANLLAGTEETKSIHQKQQFITKHTHTHDRFYGSLDFVRDNPGEPVPEETLTHSHPSSSSIIPYLLHPLWSMASCLTIFYHNLSPSFLWSTSWPGNIQSHSIHFFTKSFYTIATCFAVVLRLCHLILVSLSTLYLEFYLVA